MTASPDGARTIDAHVALVTGADWRLRRPAALGSRLGGAGFDLRPSEAALSLHGDVSEPTALGEGVRVVTERLGEPSLLVTAAGVYERAAFEDITPSRWQRMLDVHLGGTLNASRAVLPAMIARRSGCIVTVASELTLAGGCGDAHYAAAKGAILGLVRSLAVEVAGHGIRVNTVAPGPTDTPMLDDHPNGAASHTGRRCHSGASCAPRR